MYLVGFPLLLIPFAIYNIVVFLTPGVGWAEPLTRVGLPSGAEWTMSLGDLLVALAILLLLVEIIKAHRSGGRYLMDHLLSALLLIAMGAEFYLVPRATTSTFFLLLVASLADVIGGLVALRRRPAIVGSVPVGGAEGTAEAPVPVSSAPVLSASPTPAAVTPPPVSSPTPSTLLPSAVEPSPATAASMPVASTLAGSEADAARPDSGDPQAAVPNPDRP